MIEKIESYKTKDGMIFPRKGVKEIIVYVTEDGKTFTDEGDAGANLVKIENKRKFAKTIKKIKQLFEQELIIFANDSDEYNNVNIKDIDLEYDFWNEITGKCNIEVEDFEDYMLLIKALLEDFHLEETVKIVKKMMCNLTEETV